MDRYWINIRDRRNIDDIWAWELKDKSLRYRNRVCLWRTNDEDGDEYTSKYILASLCTEPDFWKEVDVDQYMLFIISNGEIR